MAFNDLNTHPKAEDAYAYPGGNLSLTLVPQNESVKHKRR